MQVSSVSSRLDDGGEILVALGLVDCPNREDLAGGKLECSNNACNGHLVPNSVSALVKSVVQ